MTDARVTRHATIVPAEAGVDGAAVTRVLAVVPGEAGVDGGTVTRVLATVLGEFVEARVSRLCVIVLGEEGGDCCNCGLNLTGMMVG